MPRATNGDVEIEYDTFGDRSDPALLLIMGFTAQMTAWDVELCRQLAGQGLYVVRFDNRDAGLSTRTTAQPPNVIALMTAAATGQPVTLELPYTLADMVGDALAVLDDLSVERAHVVGASMGGMIAQLLALDHPQRVLTLTSIMSTTGARDVGQATPQATTALLTPPPADRDSAIERTVKLRRALSGPLFDEVSAREAAAAAYDRAFHPEGAAYQLAAILGATDRTERLCSLDVPTLVIHGEADPLIDISGGRATAAAIPGAELLALPQMGHDLPQQLWPEIVGAIANLSGAAEASRR